MNLVRVGVIEEATPPFTTSNLKIRLEANDLSSYSGSGSTWTNVAGAQYSGSLLNSPSYNQSNGGWFAFDGVDESVSIQDSTVDWRLSESPITLQTWVYFDTLTNFYGAACNVLGKQSPSFALDGYTVATSATGELRISTNGQSISKTFFTSAGAIAEKTWYLITAILSISSTAGSIKGYRNSTLLINDSHGSDSYSESNSLILGRGYQRGTSPETYLNGRIGAFYAYNRELTEKEIIDNFNATRSRYGV